MCGEALRPRASAPPWQARSGPGDPESASRWSTTPGRTMGASWAPDSAALQPTRAFGEEARDGQFHGAPPGREGRVRGALTLRQTWSWPEPRPQFAFKDSMIHVQCRSHYVSHFAAFFIVARAKISVVESCLLFVVARSR